MGKHLWLPLSIFFLFLEGCVAPEVIVEEPPAVPEQVIAEPTTPVSGAAVVPEPKVVVDEKRQKELEARGFGLFNYSVLTADTCKGHYEQIREKILDLKEDIGDAEDNVLEEERDIPIVKQELAEAEQSGNQEAVKHLKDRLEEEEDELFEAEEALDDARELYQKHLIIRNEVKDYCFGLKVAL